MSRKQLLFISLSLIVAIGLISLLFRSSEQGEASKFQGGLSQETLLRKENSMFEGDSGFLDFSGNKEEGKLSSESVVEEEKQNAKPKSYLESLSPEEKSKLYERMYERFKPLVEKFPNNSLIPKKLSDEEAARKKELEDRYYQIQRDILERKDVPKSDMGFYLDTKLKRSDDMLEILKYGLENYKKTADGRPLNPEYEKLLMERLDSIGKSREEVVNAKKGLEP